VTYTNNLTRLVVIDPYNDTDRFEPAQAVLKELDIRFSLYYTANNSPRRSPTWPQVTSTSPHCSPAPSESMVSPMFSHGCTPHRTTPRSCSTRAVERAQPQQEDGRLGRRHTSMITSPGIQLSLLAEQRAATTSHRCWERAYNQADSAT
jgi:hypothetical protein